MKNNEYISVIDALPDHSNYVPCLINGMNEAFCYYNTIYKKWIEKGFPNNGVNVTHWFNLFV